MSLIKTIDELRSKIKKESIKKDFSIGFVPTMGSLHHGHMSLIKRAKQENDLVVVSIFVNPTQFAPGEDLESYPRDIEKDYNNSIEAGADIIFNPEVSEMYPEMSSTFVTVEGDMTRKLCGRTRPTHFKGVTTVVAKLFNIVKPNNAYFGQKDAQQVAVIEKMVRDLNFDVNIITCELIREEDGLAMSSRNIYLNEKERAEALILSKSLLEVKAMFLNGERDSNKLKEHILNQINTSDLAIIDYVEILDAKNLESIDIIDKKTLVALAVKFGKTRLIDNIYLEVQ